MDVTVQTTFADPLPAWAGQEGSADRLIASRETATGHCFFPPIPASSPLAGRYQPVTLSAQAVLYSFTVIHASKKANKPPVTLVYADFPENVRVFGTFEGAGRPVIGQALAVSFWRDDAGKLHYLFKPA